MFRFIIGIDFGINLVARFLGIGATVLFAVSFCFSTTFHKPLLQLVVFTWCLNLILCHHGFDRILIDTIFLLNGSLVR